ncbi:RAMP superfamily CRISPR-associated protein [Pseudonocardia oroxyli]|uniref:CRISPR/Cas system CSM-associated protein Csm3, group 7 of RAMP superfamily n=1 Tax=Pseudonocardia oroxyli TaxID=366584 RepID=A0A1G8CRH7_PSEOR|nr:RAMP superfamily CRISPR-associated protein [Pseudonocardia oroxyli]SDH47779.1 CRISPR/Cas system CSM-associated protein Csm3, group 7 of RAMP superfamily [Pseudonocardia oroxyli]
MTVAFIQVDLLFETPGGVSAPELGGAIDLPLNLARDGGAWTPPSSLAGALRSHLGDSADAWLGTPGGDPETVPSRLRLLGSETRHSEPELLRSTAINPVRGAAASSTFRSAQVLPAGSAVSLYLRVDRAQRAELDDLGAVLARWRPIVGRGRSTGRGRTRVTRVRLRVLDPATPEGLRALLGGREEQFADTRWVREWKGSTAAGPSAELSVGLVLAGPLHIGGGVPQQDAPANRAPILRRGDSALVPGTTWKGVLRARCGYILRSCGQPACMPHTDEGAACGTCRVCDLFGWTTSAPGRGRPTGHVGRLSFSDSVVSGEIVHRSHVGIDRFTGGARTGLLFSDEVVESGSLTLTVEPTRPGDQLTPADRGLLLLALRDIDDQLVGIGGGTTRGYGSLRLSGAGRELLSELAAEHPTGAAVRALLQGAAA